MKHHKHERSKAPATTTGRISLMQSFTQSRTRDPQRMSETVSAEPPLTLEHGDWELRLGDCLDPVTGLASLADKSIDHVITDPPFSRDLYTRTRATPGRPDLRSPNERKSDRELASLAIGSIDEILPVVAAQLMRVASRWVVVFHDVEIGHLWRGAFALSYVRAGAWVKKNPQPQISGDRPAQGYEGITIAHPAGRKRWNAGGRSAVWTTIICHGNERPDHPCPKPLALMEALVRDFTDEGELICDPFAGSGTTGVACRRLGRRFLGWELSPKYHAIACKRIAQTREQMRFAGMG